MDLDLPAPHFAWFHAGSPLLHDRSFEDDEEGAGVQVVADPRSLFRPGVPYFDCEEPLNMLFTTDLQFPLWIVRYDIWRTDQAAAERRDAAWLNRVVVSRLDLREVAWLVPMFSDRWREHWRWGLCMLRDATWAEVDAHVRAAAADMLCRKIVISV